MTPFEQIDPAPAASAVAVTGRIVPLNDTRIYLEEVPAADGAANASTVVLIHGFGASSYSWRNVMPRLAEHRRVIALDLPGFGFSARPEDRELYSLDGRVATVSALLDTLGSNPVHLVGHSYGGGIALRIAAESPQRIASLTLVNSIVPSHSRAPARWFWRRQPLSYFVLRSLGMSKLFVRSVLERTYYYPHRVTEEVLDGYLERLRVKGPARPYVSLPATIPLEKLAVDLRKVRVPTLVIWGEQDRLIPVETGRKAARALPLAAFHSIDRCGHMPMEERPETFLGLVEPFLARHARNGVTE